MSTLSIITAFYQGHLSLENVSILLASVSYVAIIISAAFAIFQWKKTKRFNGVKNMQQLRADLYNDKEIMETLYMFERNEKWFTFDFYKTNDIQRKVDKTLSVLEYACYLKMNKYLDQKQFSIIQYQVEKTLSNFQVQAYLFQFYHGLKIIESPMIFKNLTDYGLCKDLFDKSFKNINSSIYSPYFIDK